MKRCLFVMALLLAAAIYTNAQSEERDCAQKIRLAQSIYDQGRLQEAESILVELAKQISCNKQEKVAAYKLLCLTHIYLEEPAKADEDMLIILKTDHEFEVNEAVDPAEFVALYRTFRTTPVYRVGARIGVNASQPNVADAARAVEIGNGSKYSYGVGIQFGGVFELPISRKLTGHAEILFQQRKFNVDITVNRGTDVEGNRLTNTFTGIESQVGLSLPLTVEYKVTESSWNPYVSAGVVIDYLANAELTGERVRSNASSVSETKFDIKPIRESLNYSALLGGGIKRKLSGGFFVVDVRFLYGISEVNSASTSYQNQESLWNQGYADPVFRLNSFVVNASYVYNIYNPKKKSRK